MKCPGFFFVTLTAFSAKANFAGMCVVAATPLEYFIPGRELLELTSTENRLRREDASALKSRAVGAQNDCF